MERGPVAERSIEVVELDDAKVGEWMEMAERLMAVSPHKWKEVLDRVRGIVEGQEIIARADRQLVLRGRRPVKRYQA